MSKALSQHPLLQRIYFSLPETTRILLLSSLFSVLLVPVRFLITGEFIFFFLPWNLFLAFIPYLVSIKLMAKPAWIEHRILFPMLALVWLLFIPNSFYIITDLFHLGQSDEAPKWYDLVVIFSFAWNGLLVGVLSVRMMERLVALRYPVVRGIYFLLPVMWLNALGIYIGRYLRFNSWDVLANPFELARDIAYLVIHPFRNFQEWGMITCFTVLMMLIYETMKRLSRMIH